MTSSLFGKSIVVTRALHQADEMNALLTLRGAFPVTYPCIAIVQPEDAAALDNNLSTLRSGAYDWLIVTSSNTVFALAQRLNHLSSDPFAGKLPFKVAAVGSETALALRELFGAAPDLVPSDFNAAAIADELLPILPAGARVLLPQSEIANPALEQRLSEQGVQVTAVTAYRTVIGSGGADVPSLLRTGRINAVTFTSPSTVDNFLQRLANEGGSDLIHNIPAACIGSTTARAAQAHGFTVSIVPPVQTVNALIQALENHFAVERYPIC